MNFQHTHTSPPPPLNLVSSVKVLAHDGRLVLEHCQLEGVADHVELLVSEVHPVVPWSVAQDVEGSGGGGGGGVQWNIRITDTLRQVILSIIERCPLFESAKSNSTNGK